MTNGATSSWTSERRRELREAWLKGLTVTLIAEQLGITRGMVSGQVRLMKLSKRAPERQPTDSRKRKVKQRNVVAMKPKPQMPPTITPPTIWKTLLELEPAECRWPYGDRHFVFCAMPAHGELPYCACHARIAYHAPILRAAA